MMIASTGVVRSRNLRTGSGQVVGKIGMAHRIAEQGAHSLPARRSAVVTRIGCCG
jgi:hypothetical protein